jgi:choline dehydrogenase
VIGGARAHIRATAGTAYHPVGTLRMGADPDAPVTPELRLRGILGLHVADASVMPAVTSANTNAPSMMIGYRAGRMIAETA